MNCPDKFYNNCSNAIFKCSRCRAGKGSRNARLYYNPINTALDPHPILAIPKQTNKHVKRGLKEEKKVTSDWIKKTIKSGSLLGDGDIKVVDLNLDIKSRSTTCFTVTAQEYKAGIKKNYDGWVVTNKDGERLVCLTEKSFLRLTGKLIDQLENLINE